MLAQRGRNTNVSPIRALGEWYWRAGRRLLAVWVGVALVFLAPTLFVTGSVAAKPESRPGLTGEKDRGIAENQKVNEVKYNSKPLSRLFLLRSKHVFKYPALTVLAFISFCCPHSTHCTETGSQRS